MSSQVEFKDAIWKARQVWEQNWGRENVLQVSDNARAYIPFRPEQGFISDQPTYDRFETVEALAHECGLDKNHLPGGYQHLGISAGDINYWLERCTGINQHPHYSGPISGEQLRWEFITRRIAVEAAEKLSLPIPDQGNLSYFAEGIRGPVR